MKVELEKCNFIAASESDEELVYIGVVFCMVYIHTKGDQNIVCQIWNYDTRRKCIESNISVQKLENHSK